MVDIGQASELSSWRDFRQVPHARISPPTSTNFFNCSSTLYFSRVGGSIPPQATNPRRPTDLSWAFSFGASPEHAGCGAILRVPTPSSTWGGIDPQISYSAFSSHETSANPHAVAHAERLSRQQLTRVSDTKVLLSTC